MMFRHGVGFVPRLTQRGASPSAHEVVLFAAGHPMLGTASGHGTLTIQIAAPALHAGSYHLSIASLVGGPVCLIAPALHHDAGAGSLTVTPGLWAADMVYGAFSVQSGWLADGAPLTDTGAVLTLGPQHAGQAIRHSETVSQGGLNAVGLSGVFDVPGTGEPEPGEFALRATSDARLEAELANVRPVTITVAEPAERAGVYMLNPQELATGPVCLVSPRLEGLAVAGQELRLIAGLWTHDLTAAPISITREWRRDGASFANAGTTLLLTAADRGRTFAVVETAHDAHGTVIATTAARHVPQLGELPDTFTAPDGTPIANYIGESGLGWVPPSDPGTSSIRHRATIHEGRLKAENSGSYAVVLRDQELPAAQFIEAEYVIGSAASDNGANLVLRGNLSPLSGYVARHQGAGWWFGTLNSSAGISNHINTPKTYAAGTLLYVRWEVDDNDLCTLTVNGEVIRSFTPATPVASGRAGILVRGNPGAGVANEITQFHAGGLA